VSVALFVVLALIYLLTFSGEFSSIDELAMYAGAESLAQAGQFVTPQLTFAPFHNPVGVIEPGQSLAAAPLYALAQQFIGVNNIHAVLLLNVFVTALTAVTIFNLLRRAQYTATVACAVALCFGLATTAWPYARYFLREPLTGLLIAVAAWRLVVWRQSGRLWPLAGCCVTIACATAVKVSAAIVAPVFVVVMAFSASSRRARLWILPGAAGVLLAGAGLFLWRYGGQLPLAGYTVGYSLSDFVARSYGQLFSPAKGIAFFSPVLLIALPGWLDLWRRQRALVLLSLGALLATLYAYGNNPVWYGGWTWGPRFIIPLLPLLVLPLAGVLSSRLAVVRALALAGAGFSALMQLAAATSAWEPAASQMDVAHDPGLAWHDLRLWTRSPALFQLTHWRPEWLNLLWWHPMSDGRVYVDLLLAALLALMLAGALVGLVWSLNSRRLERRTFAIAAGAGAVLVIAGCGLLLARGYDATRDYPGLTLAEARQIAALVSAPSDSSYTLATVSNEFHMYYWLGLLKGRFMHYWYSPAAVDGFEPVLSSPVPADRLRLVVDRVHLLPEHSGYHLQFWLNRQAYPMGGEWVGGFEVFQYMLPADVLPARAVSYTWSNNIALVSFAQQAGQAYAGQALRLEFEFERVGPISENYSWFVHLAGADGRVIVARDGPPQFGAASTTLWKANERVPDRCAFVIPPDTPPGVYIIRAGFVSPTAGRIPLLNPADGAPADYVVLEALQVLPAP